LVENILLLRYVETSARLSRQLTVVKLRDSGHDERAHELQISERGATLVPLEARPRALNRVRRLWRR
jgi:KaiC/GvpD/RAD55 family RecA-like ATPase